MSIFGVSYPKIAYRYGEAQVQFGGWDTSTDRALLSGLTADQVAINDRVKFSTTVSLPPNVTAGVWYYVTEVDYTSPDEGFSFSLTKGGTNVDITAGAGGNWYFDVEHISNLQYARVLEDGPEVSQIVNESSISGHRSVIRRGDHWIFRVLIHLFKYSDPRSKFEELNYFLGKELVLWRHADGNILKDASGNNVMFILESVEPQYLERSDYRDVLILTLKSIDFVDLSDGSQIIPQMSDITVVV